MGTAADSIGVYEFNTLTDTVVGTHKFVGGAAIDAPFTSPDGEHVVLFGMNGGRTVEILKAGPNGQKSVSRLS